jgi:hypothetical protein
MLGPDVGCQAIAGGGGGEEEEMCQVFLFKLGFLTVNYHSISAPYSLACHSTDEKWANQTQFHRDIVSVLRTITILKRDITTRGEKQHNLFFLTHVFKLYISFSICSKTRCGLTCFFNGNLRKRQANHSTYNQYRDLEWMELRTRPPHPFMA